MKLISHTGEVGKHFVEYSHSETLRTTLRRDAYPLPWGILRWGIYQKLARACKQNVQLAGLRISVGRSVLDPNGGRLCEKLAD